jgi:hypothetical protein
VIGAIRLCRRFPCGRIIGVGRIIGALSGFLPTSLHGVGNDLVQFVGGIPHRAEQRVGLDFAVAWRGGLRVLLKLLEQQAGGFGHRVIDRREMPAMDGGLDRAFDIWR